MNSFTFLINEKNMKTLALLLVFINFQLSFGPVSSYQVGSANLNVGDYAFGGIIFHLDETGRHGLVCAKEDQGTGIYFRDEISVKGANGRTVGVNLASYLCSEYRLREKGRVYNDWRLPAKEELFMIYNLKDVIERTAEKNGGVGFLLNSEVSPTEYCNSPSWDLEFNYAYSDYDYMKVKINVRAVRSF